MTTSSIAPVFENCPLQLTQTQIDQYWENGWIAFENALSPTEVEQARKGISDMVRRYTQDRELATFQPGAERNGNHSGPTFKGRQSPFMMQFEPGFKMEAEDPSELELGVRKFMHFENEAEVYKRIVTDHPLIQGVLHSLLGPSIELYQSMALVKPAHVGSEKPWHQDNAYFSVEDMDGVLGTWIALDDALIANGCMHMLSGGHRLGPLRHHHTYDCEIMPGRIQTDGATPVELRAGGMVIFHANTPHQTPPNRSGLRRRALQFHYRKTSNSIIAPEVFDKIYVESDGTPASCSYARKNGF